MILSNCVVCSYLWPVQLSSSTSDLCHSSCGDNPTLLGLKCLSCSVVVFSSQLCHLTFSAQRSDLWCTFILQHYHSSLLLALCCFSFFISCSCFSASCINAAVPAVWWKTSSGWFLWLFPLVWLKVLITEISCSGFFEWNKNLQTHSSWSCFQWDPKA